MCKTQEVREYSIPWQEVLSERIAVKTIGKYQI